MSEPDGPLLARGTLVGVSDAMKGWRAANTTLALEEDLSAVLVTVRRGRESALESEALERLGAALPADRKVSFRGQLAVASSGRGRFLVVKKADRNGSLHKLLAQSLADLATVLDHSDQITFLSLEGAIAPRVLSAMCSLDFDDAAFPEGTSVVTRMHDVRAYLWREPGPFRYLIGVQRSLASYCWDGLIEACRTHAPPP